jgi:hypothetical protein
MLTGFQADRPNYGIKPSFDRLVTNMEKARTAEELVQCDSICPKHDAQCELKGYQQASYRFHGHKDADGKMCIWPKTVPI